MPPASVVGQAKTSASLTRLTLLGGSDRDAILAVAADPNGGAYLAGETRSTDFPEAIGQSPSGSNSQILLIRLNVSGDVEYAALFGGSGDDAAYSVAVDSIGQAHLTGRTSSLDFPVTPGANQTTKGGGWDSFYMTVSRDGKSVRAATYLGGAGEDRGETISLDPSGSAFIAGSTQSEVFPGASEKRRGIADAFIARLDQKTARRRYVRLVGGSNEDYAAGLTLDAGGVWVVGQTNSNDLRVSSTGLQRVKRGLWDAFVVRLDAATGQPRYASYLGGGPGAQTRGMDNAHAVSVDSAGNVWVVGETDSPDFPGGANNPADNAAGHRGFVIRLDQGASRLGYRLSASGIGESTIRGVVSVRDSVAVSGQTDSTDFPDDAVVAGKGGGGDIFALVLNERQGTAVCSLRLGGSGEERAGGVAILSNGAILTAGWTESNDLAPSPRGIGGDAVYAILRCNS